MDNAANEIAAKAKGGALGPGVVAGIIFRQIFETGPARLTAVAKVIFIGTVTAALIEWRKQLLASGDDELAKWKKLAQESKMEMEELKTQNVKLMKEAREL